MSEPKPGDRQARDNKVHKEAGSSPNGVANHFMSKLKGQKVTVELVGKPIAIGVLERFDAYSMVVTVAGNERLLFKGPGISVEMV